MTDPRDDTGVLGADELEQILAADHDPADNRPARLPGLAGVGNSPAVSPAEARRRRLAMATVLSSGWGMDEMVHFFGQRGTDDGTGVMRLENSQQAFGLSENATRMLADKVLEMWAGEDAQLAPHKKRIAERRMIAEIRAARAKNMFTAVAALENNLMKLQGTAAPIKVEAELRLTTAVVAMLGEMSADDVQALIAEEVGRSGSRLRSGRPEVLEHRPDLNPGVKVLAPDHADR